MRTTIPDQTMDMDNSRPRPAMSPRFRRVGLVLAYTCLSFATTGFPAQTGATNDSPATVEINPPAKPVPGKPKSLSSAISRVGSLLTGDLKSIERQVTNLVGRVSAAVVSVRIGDAMGSAVVISENGLVLCAAHVCGEPDLDVKFLFPDGRTAQGKTLGANHGIDSGLMKITDPGPWPHVEVGELTNARLGNWVLALGHPGGFDPRRPVVARLGRIIRLEPGFLQTDCTLISGDSGGPLFDMQGRVIGIHSRISTSTDANFHVPITTYFATWDRLANGENWGPRPPTGNYVGALGFSETNGYRLIRIEEDSPAAKAGLQVGDLITKVDRFVITDGDRYVQGLAAMKPGKESIFHIKRGKEELTVQVTATGNGRRGGPFGGF